MRDRRERNREKSRQKCDKERVKEAAWVLRYKAKYVFGNVGKMLEFLYNSIHETENGHSSTLIFPVPQTIRSI